MESHWLYIKYLNWKELCKSRNIDFDIEYNDIFEIFLKQNAKCAFSKQELTEFNIDFIRYDFYKPNSKNNIYFLTKDVREIYFHLGFNTDKLIEICKLIANNYNNRSSKRGRPPVDQYFLTLACVAATRSEDPHTRHGAVIVENNTNYVLSTGTNGLVRGFDDQIASLERPAKYDWMIHAEENAIMNCTKHPSSTVHGARIYITGLPCVSCLQRVINYGIKEITYIDRQGTSLETKESKDMFEKIQYFSGITINKISAKDPWIAPYIETI